MTGHDTDLPHKPASTEVPIHDLLATRWSPRAFDATRAVTREQISALIEAARWAPSCFGNEPWRFLVWDRATDDAGWQRAFDCLSAGNQIWVKNVPLLFAAVADPAFDHNGKPNRWAQYDTGAAAENLVLQAVALGLAAHQMGGFDAERLHAEFGIPAGVHADGDDCDRLPGRARRAGGRTACQGTGTAHPQARGLAVLRGQVGNTHRLKLCESPPADFPMSFKTTGCLPHR